MMSPGHDSSATFYNLQLQFHHSVYCKTISMSQSCPFMCAAICDSSAMSCGLSEEPECCYEMTPIFFLLYFTYFTSCHVSVMWPHCDSLFLWQLLFRHIVLWPIVQGDSIVPVTPIVLVTLLFSCTISTSSLWPYSLRLDFCILRYRQAIRAPFPTLIPCPLLSQGYSL